MADSASVRALCWKRAHPGQAAEYQRRHRGKYQGRYLNKQLMRNYGIGLAQYDALFAEQGGVCAVCQKPETRLSNKNTGIVRKLAVDHCHTTGGVRGLLCVACNTALGLFKDDPAILTHALEYINQPIKRP